MQNLYREEEKERERGGTGLLFPSPRVSNARLPGRLDAPSGLFRFFSREERKTGACSRDKGARVHAIETNGSARRDAGRGVSEDREAEVEEDGSKPDTRFVRRVYPVSRK